MPRSVTFPSRRPSTTASTASKPTSTRSANAWSVSVRWSYARFAVWADGGSPVGSGDGTAYVREDETVSFDADGNDAAKCVSRNECVSVTWTGTPTSSPWGGESSRQA